MTDYTDLIARLRDKGRLINSMGFIEREEIARAIEALLHERDTFYMDYRMKCDAETKALLAERDRLQAQVEVAEAGYINAVTKAEWQSSTNAELNRLIRQRNDISMECDRLREELAAGEQAFHEEADTVARLRAELAAAQKDAERYRWLRKHPINGLEETTPCIRAAENDLKHWALTGDDADAAIDAAMAQEKRDE